MGKFIVNDQRTIECAKKGAAKTMSLYGKGHLLKIVADYRRAHPSNLEAAVADMLNGIGVFFDSNAVIGEICVADFLLGNKVIIETDGEYWHNQRQASDAARDTKLRDDGYQVLRLSEQFIVNCPDECVAVIANFLANALED
jgi:very-short-patch-repair endonuclease